jgi:ribonuclease HI
VSLLLDSEYVRKGITEWTRWKRQGFDHSVQTTGEEWPTPRDFWTRWCDGAGIQQIEWHG